MLTAIFIAVGYLSGSVLYARVFARLFNRDNMIESSKDKNPGTANAFMYGGFLCGMLTLVFDILKGFVPVFLFMNFGNPDNAVLTAVVIAAPVIGHVFPIYYGFKGGKGIAVTFGSLLGLFPIWQPVAILALLFIFFSVVLRVTPHFYRTYAAYISALAAMLFLVANVEIRIGFLIITAAVLVRLHTGKEDKENMGVKLLWIH